MNAWFPELPAPLPEGTPYEQWAVFTVLDECFPCGHMRDSTNTLHRIYEGHRYEICRSCRATRNQ